MSATDPRPILFRSLDQATRVVDGVTVEQLHLPTPCREFDVTALLTHVVGVAGRVGSIARGEPQTDELPQPDGLSDLGWGRAMAAYRDQAAAAWADDEVLARTYQLPFGSFDGATVAQIYLLELTTHSWDLALATDQVADLDDELAEASLPLAQAVLPPENRGAPVPFDAVVAVADDAPAYHRLAGYLGRSVA